MDGERIAYIRQKMHERTVIRGTNGMMTLGMYVPPAYLEHFLNSVRLFSGPDRWFGRLEWPSGDLNPGSVRLYDLRGRP